MEFALDPPKDAVTIDADPFVFLRPEGEWDRPGVLDRSRSPPRRTSLRVVIMFHVRSGQAQATRHLVCLDLIQCAEPPTAQAQARIDKCRRLLTYARTADWTMSHVYPHTAGRSTKPLAGLEPLPSEPVYYRTRAPRPSPTACSAARSGRGWIWNW